MQFVEQTDDHLMNGEPMTAEEVSVFHRLLITIKSSQRAITTKELFDDSLALPRVCRVQSTRLFAPGIFAFKI
jgi:hypothetical protein